MPAIRTSNNGRTLVFGKIRIDLPVTSRGEPIMDNAFLSKVIPYLRHLRFADTTYSAIREDIAKLWGRNVCSRVDVKESGVLDRMTISPHLNPQSPDLRQNMAIPFSQWQQNVGSGEY